MASLARGPNGRHRILVTVGDRRETVSLNSKIPPREAQKILQHVEELATAANYGTQRAPQTSRWLAELSPKFRARLAAKGLCEPAESPGIVAPKSLGAMIDTIKANEWATLATSTVAIYERVSDNLRNYFGADRKPDRISPGDAEAFATWLRSHENLATATANKRAAIASKFFRSAIKYRWVEENPFESVKKTNVATTRFRFVETAEAEAVLEKLPTLEWKLLFALSRWGGLRVASEPRQLKWGHVDWEQNRLLVRCPKTANAGRAIRVVPIFPELYPLLRERFESPQDGVDWVLPMLRGISDAALRRPLQRAIRAAGVEVWPRLWHSMRASRQIELTDKFPANVVADWVGNSVATAQRHYLRTTSDHFARAVARAS
ncbi:Integrase [Durusdinium trenchii]|uniref:Integrase n=1 Tax=Durusdinium trenchii TaxID=1381693 RepID=A0ABP0LH26_9DINO